MITPDQFKSIDEFLLAVNKLKLDKHSCSVLAYDQWIDREEDSANQFIDLYRQKGWNVMLGCGYRLIPDGVYVGGVE
jgi:hypothetical protein